MKKSNWIIAVVLAVAAGFFLWLWYYLGFNFVDDPFDLVLAIGFWALIVALIIGISKAEQARCRRIRTVYVSGHSMFNSERGMINFEENAPTHDAIATILSNLKYNFAREDLPNLHQFGVEYIIRSTKFDAHAQKNQLAQTDEEGQPSFADSQQVSPLLKQTVGAAAIPTEKKEWRGEVVVVKTKETYPFETPEELAEILASFTQFGRPQQAA